MGDIILQPIRKMPNAFTRDEILCTFKYTFWGHTGTFPKIFFLDIQSTFKKSWLPYSIRKWVSKNLCTKAKEVNPLAKPWVWQMINCMHKQVSLLLNFGINIDFFLSTKELLFQEDPLICRVRLYPIFY